ncbi:MAG: CoA-binding protein [Dehalococcoidales bacterium]|nr:CoA-binding protein [Dehalococcoidales bacterium]
MTKEIIRQLDYIFKPKSIAIVGASNGPGKWGYRMVNNPLTTGYRGAIYPVNPTEKQICGLPAYANVRDIPGDVDMAVMVAPAQYVPQAMRDCAAKGIKGVVMITAGFAETGAEGKALQEEVVKIAQAGGIRFVGPNGMGIYTSAVNLSLSFDAAPRKGKIAFVSQSGTFGGMLAGMAAAKGYGLSKFVSIGNQADLKAADYLEYLADDPDTGAIVFYMEGFKDGRRFFEIAREVVKNKPIIIYKSGRTEAATRATMSHTSSIAGSDRVFEAMCKQAGIIRSYETGQMFDMAEALVSMPLPQGNRIAIIGSGGQGVTISDNCELLGLKVPEFDEETKIQLKKSLPAHAPMPSNPVDFAGGTRTADDEAKVAEALAQIPYIDGIITNMPMYRGWGGNVAAAHASIEGAEIVAGIPKKYGKPVITLRWRAGNGDIAQDIVRAARIPAYDTPEQAARAMYALVEYARIRRALESEPIGQKTAG